MYAKKKPVVLFMKFNSKMCSASEPDIAVQLN